MTVILCKRPNAKSTESKETESEMSCVFSWYWGLMSYSHRRVTFIFKTKNLCFKNEEIFLIELLHSTPNYYYSIYKCYQSL